MNNRTLVFEKIANARDLGGLRTAQGSVVAPGCLIRSAHLADATAADCAALRTQDRLACGLDLRTAGERSERPDPALPGVEYLPMPVFEGAVAGISHERENMAAFLAALPKLEQLYGKMVTDPACLANLGRAARRVMEQDFARGSVLWHCTKGKDRCGLLSAVLLLALGVPRSTVRADYLLTNRAEAARTEALCRQMLAAGRPQAEVETVRDMLLAKESYLDAALAAIDAQHGGTEGFLREGLQLPPALLEQFRRSVLR